MQYAASATHDDWRIESHDIAVGEEIGRGAFGAVHKSRYHGTDVVVKKLLPTVNEADRQVALKLLNNEVRQLSKLRHKNIVQLIGVCVDPMMLVLDYAEHGNLKEYISRNPSVPMRDKLDMLSLIHISEPTRPY